MKILYLLGLIAVLAANALAHGTRRYDREEIKYENLDPTLENDPRCPGIEYAAGIKKESDGYYINFKPDVSKSQVGYVDIHWALLKKNNPTSLGINEYDFRMKKEARDVFISELKKDVDENVKIEEGDSIRYFFRYWVVPQDSIDSGFLCTTHIKWFGLPILTRSEL